MPSERTAVATLVTTESYVIGALVLGHSLRQSGYPGEGVVLVSADVSQPSRERLSQFWSRVIEVEPIVNPTATANLPFQKFATTYTKLRLWQLTDYRKVIYLDADTVVLRPIDDLLDRPHFAAAPCLWPPDMFNTAVLVLEPSEATFQGMRAQVGQLSSYDRSDQGFLNHYFSGWFQGPPEHRLPVRYNVSHILYVYGNVWEHLLPHMRVLHFPVSKPWKVRWPFTRRMIRKALQWFARAPRDGPSPVEIWWEIYNTLPAGTSRLERGGGLISHRMVGSGL